MKEKVEEPANNSRAWYRDGLQFTCTQCGHCCKIKGYVWVDKPQIEAIARHLNLSTADFGKKYLRTVNGHTSLTEKPNHECIFWENGCSIYPVRPTQCRTFPFWPYQLRSKEGWDSAAEECPGMNHGKTYTVKDIQKLKGGRGDTGKAKDRG